MSQAPVTYRAQFSSRRVVSLLAALPVLLAAAPAVAQTPAVSGEVSAQRFDPAPGTKNFLSTRALRTDGEMVIGAGFMVNYAYQPIMVRGCDAPCAGPDADPNANEINIPVVENLVTADILASLVVMPALQVSAKLPVTWLNGQGIQDDGTTIPEGLSGAGLGDLQVEGKYRFYGEADGLINAGAYGFIGFPLGNLMSPGTYVSNASISGGLSAVVGGTLSDLTWAANVGAYIREEATIGLTTLGPELRVSAGAGYAFGPIVRLIADLGLGTGFGTSGSTNVEIDGGVQITPIGFPLTITAGGGAGILQGIGTPVGRGMLGAMYSAESRDRDKDGINDDQDGCATDAEDKDGFEDSDGCPEVDNDQDNVADASDKCPTQAEDFDEFEDTDGCPEADNDKDGVVDERDACKLEPETKNDFQDDDGCPDEKDTDGDGVKDAEDKCPAEAEDTDGFDDTDGCPDPDNDADGFPDNQDECIDLPEDGKGKGPLKTDGCPVDA
jgi:OmpA-OmpF porin, OOP family